MYSRRDTFRLLFGAAAIAAVPALSALPSTLAPQAVIADALGDLLPCNGEWIKVTDFPALSQVLQEKRAQRARWAETYLKLYPRSRHAARYHEELKPVVQDGLIRLPKREGYTQFYGLTSEGAAIYEEHVFYLKAVPTPDVDVDDPHGFAQGRAVGWEVEVINYKVQPA